MMAVTELKFWAAKINFLQQSVRSYEKASDVFAWMRGKFFVFSFSAGYFRIIRQNERNHSEVFFYHSFQESNLKIVPKGSIEPIIPKQQKIKEKSGDAVVRS